MLFQGQVSLSNHWQVMLWNIGEKNVSSLYYFRLIHFWLRNNFMSYNILSYGTSSHLAQCISEELSFEATTKERLSSDPC